MPKLYIDLPKFRESFALAASWASRNKAHVSLQGVLIECDGERVTLKATDNENAITVTTDAAHGDALQVLVPAAWFAQVLAKMGGDEATLIVDERGSQIKSDRANHKFATQDARDFPVSKPTKGERYLISSEMLARAIKATIYACDSESPRYALSGPLFEVMQGNLFVVATNGRRMAICRSEFSGSKFGNTIVPQAACQQLVRVLQAIPGDAHLFVDASSVTVAGNGIEAQCRLLEGRFPQWRSSIPSVSSSLDVHAGTLLAAIDQVALALDEESRGVDFEIKDGTLSLSASTASTGRNACIEIPVACSDELKFTLNCDYVRDCLRVHRADALISVGYGGSGPVVFTCGNTKAVIMGMKRD